MLKGIIKLALLSRKIRNNIKNLRHGQFTVLFRFYNRKYLIIMSIKIKFTKITIKIVSINHEVINAEII